MPQMEILVPRVGATGVGKPAIETTKNDQTGQETTREIWPSVHTWSQEKGDVVEMSDKDAADAIKAGHARPFKEKK